MHRHCPIPWQYHDLTDLDPDTGRERSLGFECTDRQTRFTLDQAPLIRATLLRLAPNQHRLLLTQHHLLGDGWSGTLLLRDLLMGYREGPSALPPAPSFSTYLSWLQKQNKDASRDAWRAYLRGIDGSTKVVPSAPADAPSQQAQYDAILTLRLTTQLERLARQHGLTLATVLQAVWAILLSVLSGRDDVIYGMVNSGRHAPVREIERMLGLVITTTPVRARLIPAESVLVFMQRLQNEQATLLPHHHLSLAEIHQLVDAEPLFDTVFTYQNYPVDPILNPRTSQDLPLRAIRGHNSNHYPLSLAALPAPQLGLRIHYDAHLFTSAHAERMTMRLRSLLEQIVRNPMVSVDRLEVLDPDERRQLLERSDTAATAQTANTLVDLFEQQAVRHADRVAVVCESEEITYAALEVRANRLAWRLIAEGIGPEHQVVLFLERSVAYVAALLSTLKAGAAFVPIDTEAPPARLALLFGDLAPSRVLTTASLLGRLPETMRARTICIDEVESESEYYTCPPTAPTDADRLTPLHPAHSAYIIYTSGSTGAAKGVVITHAGLPNLASAQSRHCEVTENSRVLQLASWQFDATVSEIAMTFCSGATLVIAGRHERSGEVLDLLITHAGITHATFAPTVLQTLSRSVAETLESIIVAGEACPATLAAEWALRCRVTNAYGPAETTVCATMSRTLAGEGPPPDWTAYFECPGLCTRSMVEALSARGRWRALRCRDRFGT